MQIMKSIHHLMEVGPGNSFREFTSVGHKVKELTSAHILQHNGEAVVCALILFLVCSVISNTNQFDQILVVEDLHDIELVLESFKGRGFLLVLFDGDESALFVFSQFDSRLKKRYCAW